MAADINHWKKVAIRVLWIVVSIIMVILSFKLAIFYIPFLIAFIISLLIEPLIKYLMKKTKFSRRASSIIVFALALGIIVGVLIWGITTLISESSSLLHSLNEYLDKGYELIQNIINNIDYEKIHISNEVINSVKESVYNFINKVRELGEKGVINLINVISAIPTIVIYAVITILALYFICTDKIYIIDQFEHHLPKSWAKKIGKHTRKIIKVLGNYLKAQFTLILISFIICIIGLYILKIAKLNIHFPLMAALGICLVDALPILGSGTVMIPWATISAIQGDIKLGISLIILWLIMCVVRQIIEPKIVSNKIGIHPIFTLIAMYTGFKFMGFIGMFIGPIILIILKNIYATLIDNGIFKTILDED